MKVNIDTSAGFCWGVVRAIDFAENELKDAGRIYSLGDIIHNAAEVKRLNDLGMETITVEDFPRLEPGSKVLIRAHGEPPSTYQKAIKYGIEIIDATCPVVAKVQERIRKFSDEEFQVVIFGKKDHAEVIGLRGVTEDRAILVLSPEEALLKVDFSRKTVLFSQTTMDRETFARIAEALRERISQLYIGSIEEEAAIEFHAKNTICGQVSGRDKKLREFARSNDVIIFAAGKKSSNGKVLFNIAREENQRVYFVEDAHEISPEWFEKAESIGITGATSTPKWQMQMIKTYIENNFS
ncbi:MAG: 4-hydroxy-3-methylbut-2-enyl diphosphate reductase [Ignavibacteria bacterium]|jgi:4-hydroxy-3-methylbut-2-enyl diphosphate reductase|nr:4-hydroxy-3-methylbut-2-enyl diphosphate reductase [Ignavibacteria bacterium]MCU7502391.1 4-hydroxy-3-methylbut-2-enyl diphosphate reductase [Ignavibacteria bacterium]MCU7515044.1 4-hydroxy-3-methylbut-2-enyl diphosphate reductase [Ignavibacteria bacterium]